MVRSKDIRAILGDIVRHYVGAKPEEIFHYTTSAGLLGILEAREFWVHKYDYMNDPGEMKYSAVIVSEALLACLGNVSAPFMKKVIKWLAKEVCIYPEKDAVDFFVLSFSEKGDDLDAWRAYGDNGKGVALGVRAGASIGVDHEYVRKVLYEVSEIRVLVSRQVIAVESMLNDLLGFCSEQVIAEEMLWYYLDFCVQIKHSAYMYEKEYRLVRSLNGDKPRFRLGRDGRVVPYVSASLPSIGGGLGALISSVTLGPSSICSERDVKYLTGSLLGGITIPIKPSSIPYISS